MLNASLISIHDIKSTNWVFIWMENWPKVRTLPTTVDLNKRFGWVISSLIFSSISCFFSYSSGLYFTLYFLFFPQAYKKWVKEHGLDDDLPGLDLNHDQLFFLNYAQIWCGSMRPEDALSKLRSSVHSPGVIRVLGPLSNSKEFSDAYSCPIGSPMNPSHKCSVW